MKISHFLSTVALGALCVSLPACNSGGGGGGGGKGGNNGEATPDNNTNTTDEEPNTPNKQEPVKPEVEDYAPASLYGYTLTTSSNTFRISTSGSASWNSKYFGYVYYKKTGVNTGILEFNDMEYDNGSPYAVIKYDFVGTVEFVSKDRVLFEYEMVDRSYGLGVPHGPVPGPFSLYYDVTHL